MNCRTWIVGLVCLVVGMAGCSPASENAHQELAAEPATGPEASSGMPAGVSDRAVSGAIPQKNR